MSDPTELYLPSTLAYPITLVSCAIKPSQDIKRGARLFSYSFVHFPTPDAQPETRFGTWDSSIEGTVAKLNFKQGDVISQRKARDVPAILIAEPCKHGVQIGGLCGLCGKDMTDLDYTGFSDASRASIQMTHLANGPTVSLEEALRIERETAERLLKSRKLSLIVDLDQTIVHAAVDPTVGDWITEGEAWEARQASKNGAAQNGTSESISEGGSPQDADDEVNPNWEALKDVKKFRLGPEALGQATVRGHSKDKGVENKGCMYYIKPRPGWESFLSDMVAKYEMHVYTMGTRAYAEEVCAALDPSGKIFGGRILSRDESGSMTQKSLQRLFPCDQSMVVIIDDRADVWEWSPNLVKVIPYDFFLGIGDINSAFLPKVAALVPELPPEAAKSTISSSSPPSPAPSVVPESGVEVSSEAPLISSPGPLPSPDDDEALRKSEILTMNHMALDAQVEERPLAKKQEELLEIEEESPSTEEKAVDSAEAEKPVTNGHSAESSISSTPEASGSKGHHKAVRKALLKNDDVELTRVQRILEDVHSKFFVAYEARPSEERLQGVKRRSRSPRRKQSVSKTYDVRMIIPQLRQNTLHGVHILFSSVIPLDTRPQSTEIWKTALAFGAQCYTELNPNITHVVAAKRGTLKVDSARRQGGIKIVWLSWFTDSIAFWSKQDETPYLLDPDPVKKAGNKDDHLGPASPPSDPQQISSDPEPDADDWDDEQLQRTLRDKDKDRDKDRDKAEAGSGSSEKVAFPSSKDEPDPAEVESFAGPLQLGDVDWDDINDEVDAAMNESDDDDDGKSDRSMKSGNASENEDWTDETDSMISSTHSTPRKSRKRLRSITPSDNNSRGGTPDSDILRSPLAKRKRLAFERSGNSKLKEGFTANDLPVMNLVPEFDKASRASSVSRNGTEDSDDDSDEDGEGGFTVDLEDDFLTREFGEEWG